MSVRERFKSSLKEKDRKLLLPTSYVGLRPPMTRSEHPKGWDRTGVLTFTRTILRRVNEPNSYIRQRIVLGRIRFRHFILNKN